MQDEEEEEGEEAVEKREEGAGKSGKVWEGSQVRFNWQLPQQLAADSARIMQLQVIFSYTCSALECLCVGVRERKKKKERERERGCV